ncbi:MAG: integrase [Ruminococcaceae bacterium]|nr:integrase [Oscillospiraceae bacterium]
MSEKKITTAQLEEFRRKLTEDEKSQATIAKYCRDVDNFLLFAGDGVVKKEDVIRYKQHLIEKYAPASVNSMLAALNRFFKESGRYDCVVKALKIQRQAFRGREQELSKEEYYRLLEAAKKKNDTRLYMLMQTLCATGIRISELRFITVEALRHGRASVSLKGKTRQVLIPKALSRKLERYAKDRGIRSGSIFVTRSGKPMDRSNIFHQMKTLCDAARVAREKVFPHNLRHLFACLYYKVEKDLSRLADLLGHSSLNTTRIYTSLSGAEQQRQINRLGLVL